MLEYSDQGHYGSYGICFGCGPKNSKGLQINSHWEGEDYILRYTVDKEEHQAFKGIVNGGIIGTLFDCHSNWCAATTLYKKYPESPFPSTVTSEFHVKLKRPTPMNTELLVKAKVSKIEEMKVSVQAEMNASGKTTATCFGVFIAVPEGHPAHHRWK